MMRVEGLGEVLGWMEGKSKDMAVILVLSKLSVELQRLAVSLDHDGLLATSLGRKESWGDSVLLCVVTEMMGLALIPAGRGGGAFL